MAGRLEESKGSVTGLLALALSGLKRLRQLRHQTQPLYEKSLAALDRLAVAFLESEDQRINVALERTEQHLAHLYERLALRHQEGERP